MKADPSDLILFIKKKGVQVSLKIPGSLLQHERPYDALLKAKWRRQHRASQTVIYVAALYPD